MGRFSLKVEIRIPNDYSTECRELANSKSITLKSLVEELIRIGYFIEEGEFDKLMYYFDNILPHAIRDWDWCRNLGLDIDKVKRRASIHITDSSVYHQGLVHTYLSAHSENDPKQALSDVNQHAINMMNSAIHFLQNQSNKERFKCNEYKTLENVEQHLAKIASSIEKLTNLPIGFGTVEGQTEHSDAFSTKDDYLESKDGVSDSLAIDNFNMESLLIA